MLLGTGRTEENLGKIIKMLYTILLFLLFFSALLESMAVRYFYSKTVKNYAVLMAEKEFNFVTYFLLAMVLTLVSALRGGLGTDWINYKKIFDAVLYNPKSVDTIYRGVEKGYLLVNVLVSKFTDNYFVLQFLLSIFTCAVIFGNFWKNSKAPFVLIFIYYVSNYFGINFEIVRQGIATAIILLGLKTARNRSFLLWCLIIMLAMQFHVSSIVAFPLYFSTYRKISKRFALIMLCTALVITFFGNAFIRSALTAMEFIPFLPKRIIHLLHMYLAVSSKHGKLVEFNSGLGIIVIYVIYGFMIFLTFKDGKNKSKEYFVFNFLIYLVIMAIGRNVEILGRCATYYFISGNGIFAYSLIFEKDSCLYKKLDFIRIFIVMLFIAFNTLSFYKGFNKERPSGKSNADYYIPYKTFLD